MNPIQFECPHCHSIIAGDEAMYGLRVKCAKCQAQILVPERPVENELKTARLISNAAGRTAPALGVPEPETDIFQLSPVARSFSGLILLAILLLGLAGALALHAQQYPWAPASALVAAALGVIVLLWVAVGVKASSYRLTTQRLFVRRGWLAKHVDELELYRVKDVVVDQGVFQRLLGYGTVAVLADDDTTPRMELVSIARPTEIKEMIRTHYRAARQREGVRPTEFMHSP